MQIQLSGRELDQLFRTADVRRVIGHRNNRDAVKEAAKRLNLPHPLGTFIANAKDSNISVLYRLFLSSIRTRHKHAPKMG